MSMPERMGVLIALLGGWWCRSAFAIGRDRMRVPVAAKIALQMAGAKGGRAGSPSPVGGFVPSMKCTSMRLGAASMRSTG